MAQAAVRGRLRASAPRLATKRANLMNFTRFTSLTPIRPAATSQPPRLRDADGSVLAAGGQLGTEAARVAAGASLRIISLVCSLIPFSRSAAARMLGGRD